MSSLSMIEAELPSGFRFHPRDDELVCDYLLPMRASSSIGSNRGYYGRPVLVDVDLNKVEPWDLPVTACVGGKEWFFFSLRDRKYATGERTNRATVSGYWKATGKDRIVRRRGIVVGMRKTLVFYKGRAPKGKKTEWVMHEFRAEPTGNGAASDDLLSPSTPKLYCKKDWVLCKVFNKCRGISPKTNTSSSNNFNTVLTDCGGGGGNEDSGSSSFLPPLTTDTYISFDQQVPCFSNIIIPTTINNNGSIAQLQQNNNNNNKNQIYGGGGNFEFAMMNNNSSFYIDDQVSCDKKIMKTVLDQLTAKIDDHHHDNYFGDHHHAALVAAAAAGGLPSIWSSFSNSAVRM